MVHRALPLGGVAVLALALACGQSRQVSGAVTAAASGPVATCTRCHGDPSRVASASTDPLIAAAPPKSVRGGENPGDPGVGAHQLHLADGPYWKAVPCASCHRLPQGGISHPLQDQLRRVSFSGLATTAWPGQPAVHGVWNGTSCSATYCHGGFLGGNSGNAPEWLAPRADACGTCHDLPPPPPHPAVASDLDTCKRCHPDPYAGGTHVDGQVELTGHGADWLATASAGFHAFSANGGIASCQYCHQPDLSGGFTGVACSSCHDGGVHGGVTVVAFQVGGSTNCVACHGGTDNSTGAPPRATWGKSGDAVRVGAHTTHVAAGYDCSVCHVKPTEMLSSGHIDGLTATVTFGGMALTGSSTPSWDRGTARCSATYCHGSLAGGSNPSPDWTRVGQGEAACGTCHGLPPASFPSPAHPVYTFAAPCLGCHPATATQDAGGRDVLVAGGPHLDGGVQFTFAGHPAGWAVPGTNGTVGGLHSNENCLGCGPNPGTIDMTQYYTECTQCHGANGDFSPSGGTSRVSCGACHPAFFTAGGTTSCNFCH
jgi:predicted CxxxxCH...CXXCH cytochrome family protein